MGSVQEPYSPLLTSSSIEHKNQLLLHSKTGTIWTAIAHIITAIIGAGVLSLAWSVAQLGWVLGPLAILVFAAVTVFATNLLCDCYRSPDSEFGTTVNRSYLAAVRHYLGLRSQGICSVLLKESLFGTAVAYTITAAVSIRSIQKSVCYHREGRQASCTYSDNMYILLFGCIQVIISQIPDFHNMKWLSVVAALMSFGYSTIGLGLGFTKVIENGEIKGSITGVPITSSLMKWSLVFQALGDVAYSFPYTGIVLEIQDTIKSIPENKTMKKASLISILIATFFFLFCACSGYAAFGDDTPGSMLTGFEFYEPSWIVDLANACIVVHLLGGYQLMEVDDMVTDDHLQEEYVLLDLDAVCDQVDIPPGEPYTLSGLDTLNPILTIGDKFKLIGEYEETIGTCLIFSENNVMSAETTATVDEGRGSSGDNQSKDAYAAGPNQASSKQVKPITSLQKILKFRLLSETNEQDDSTKKPPDLPENVETDANDD